MAIFATFMHLPPNDYIVPLRPVSPLKTHQTFLFEDGVPQLPATGNNGIVIAHVLFKKTYCKARAREMVSVTVLKWHQCIIPLVRYLVKEGLMPGELRG